MKQLIKQVLKSFKSSFLLLFGMFFIIFAIIFSTFSSVYFSKNLSKSYNDLTSQSNAEDAILEIGKGKLDNDNLTQSIYLIKFDWNDHNNIKKPIDDSNRYFLNHIDYSEEKNSFMYQQAVLSKLRYKFQPEYSNYIFPYYIAKDSNGTNINPFFEAPGINDKSEMFRLRAKGILKSYGYTEIPKNYQYWRANGLKLKKDQDPKYIVYEIDPFTGLTEQAIDPYANGNNQIGKKFYKSKGFFNDGIFKNKIDVLSGTKKYPTNVISYNTSTEISENYNYQVYFDDKASPFFVSQQYWHTDINFDLFQYGSIAKLLDKILKKEDVFNLMSSMHIDVPESIPLGDFNWKLSNINPLSEYIEIFHDKQYISNAKLYDSTSSKDVESDLIFNIHIDETQLNQLQLETLEYIKTNDIEKYNELTRFVYSVNTSWIKEELIKDYPSIVEEVKNKNFNDLKDLQYEFNIGNDKTISGKEIVEDWIYKYSLEEEKKLVDELIVYEKEYLSSILKEQNNNTFNIQKSFTIVDSQSSNSFLVSAKNESDCNESSCADVNKLVVSDGTKLKNSTKYLDVIDTLFKTTYIPNSVIRPNENANNWSANPNGHYFINLVKIIKDANINGFKLDDPLYPRVTYLSNKIWNNYRFNNIIDPNDYYELFSLVPIKIENNEKKMISTSNQNLDIKINVKYGISFVDQDGWISKATPYGHAVIVTEKWLVDNGKKVLSKKEWDNAINENKNSNTDDGNATPDNSPSHYTEEFLKWKKSLNDKYVIDINSRRFIIIGIGHSAENAYPIVAVNKPIPNSHNESLIYVNNQGYDSILSTNNSVIEDEYFAIKFKNLDIYHSTYLYNINKIMDKLVQKKAYFATDTTYNKNLLTLRYSFPIIIDYYVQMFALIIVLLLVAIGIYLSFLIIKTYVDSNQTSLAIVKANGMSTWKIVLSLSIVVLFIALLAGMIGYIAAHFTQYLFLDIIKNYWFIKVTNSSFSPLWFLGSGLIVYVFFFLFCFIGILILFKTPISALISKNTDMKINKSLFIFKGLKFNMPVVGKFTSALILNKIGKFSLLTIMCSFALSVISVGGTLPLKFKESQQNTQSNRNYSYSFELITPTEQSGLYRVQDYADLGVSNANIGINGIHEGSVISYNYHTVQPYTYIWNETDLSKKNNRDLFALRDLEGNVIVDENGNKEYFSSLILPSYSSYNLVIDDIDFFRNAVFSKWLLDFDITVSSLSLNAWDLVKQSMSSELVSMIDAISSNFLNEILSIKQLKEVNDIGSGTKQNPRPFIISEDDGKNKKLGLMATNVITPIDPTDLHSIRFNNEFLKFIGMVYGSKELSSKDIKFAYGIIPMNKEMETYTYVDSVIVEKKGKDIQEENQKENYKEIGREKIIGIDANSTYVTLKNYNDININNLLEDKIIDKQSSHDIEEEYYPIIVNSGAELKYGFKKGDKFEIVAINTYDRFSKKFYKDESINTIKFKVVDVASDAFGVSFYTSQKFANEILKLNFEQGAMIISDFVRETKRDAPFDIADYTFKGIGKPNIKQSENYNEEYKIYSSNNFKVEVMDYKKIYPMYVPFNGIFSREKDPLLLSSMTIQSSIGFWSIFHSIDSNEFANILSKTNPYVIFDMIVPFWSERVDLFKKYLAGHDKYKDYKWTENIRDDVIEILISEYPLGNKVLSNYLESIFGDEPISISLSNIDFFKSTFATYTTIFNSFLVIQNVLIAIFVPIIIMVILIVSSVMINEFKKMLAILKTLGYRDKDNLKILYITFIPVLIISMLIGIGMLWLMLFSVQSFIFNLSVIYISLSINWLPYLYGSLGIISIILLNFVYMAIYLKKQNIKQAII